MSFEERGKSNIKQPSRDGMSVEDGQKQPGHALEGLHSVFPGGPPPLGGAWPVEETQA